MTNPRPLPWQASQWQAIAAALQQQRMAHALLLVGPRGIGKRYFTALLAQALLCAQPDESRLPCGSCKACVLVQAGTHPDLIRLEKEEGSKVVKVDDLREFNRLLFLTPRMGEGVVGIIDPVDGLNRNSSNALLKSLEEPPPGAHILLVGERWMSLAATLRSRCLILHFPLPPADAVTKWLSGERAVEKPELGPLRARYARNTTTEQAWCEALAAMCLGKEDPIALADQWKTPEDALPGLLDWMQGCIADLLKLKTQAPEACLSNPHSLKPLKAMSARLPMPVLVKLSQLALETRQLLDSQAKPQMLLENMLTSWYQGSRSGASRTRR